MANPKWGALPLEVDLPPTAFSPVASTVLRVTDLIPAAVSCGVLLLWSALSCGVRGFTLFVTLLAKRITCAQIHSFHKSVFEQFSLK